MSSPFQITSSSQLTCVTIRKASSGISIFGLSLSPLSVFVEASASTLALRSSLILKRGRKDGLVIFVKDREFRFDCCEVQHFYDCFDDQIECKKVTKGSYCKKPNIIIIYWFQVCSINWNILVAFITLVFFFRVFHFIFCLVPAYDVTDFDLYNGTRYVSRPNDIQPTNSFPMHDNQIFGQRESHFGASVRGDGNR